VGWSEEHGRYSLQLLAIEKETPMLTVAQVADRLSCSRALVYQLCAEGRIAHHRLGLGRGTIRIEEEEVQEYLNETQVSLDMPRAATGFHHLRLPVRRRSAE
jgi:excisionase family DNA binding protein